MAAHSSSADRINSFGDSPFHVVRLREGNLPDDPVRAKEEIAAAIEELRTAPSYAVQNEELLGTQTLLEEERERYRDLFEMAPDGYVVTDERSDQPTRT